MSHHLVNFKYKLPGKDKGAEAVSKEGCEVVDLPNTLPEKNPKAAIL
jgi:hypothetical protein